MQQNHQFFMACLRDTVGSNVAFHGINGAGYHTDLTKAQSFSKEEAQKFWDGAREFDLPLRADLVDSLSVFHVDCQHIPHKTTLQAGCTQYVGFLKRRWDGNDVYWLSQSESKPQAFETDFQKATIFSEPLDMEDIVWIPFEMADRVKRKTFNVGLINKRAMIQAAGLLTPAHVKRAARKKPSSGKTRWNCPECGKISWQHNPYDFEGCTSCGAK